VIENDGDELVPTLAAACQNLAESIPGLAVETDPKVQGTMGRYTVDLDQVGSPRGLRLREVVRLRTKRHDEAIKIWAKERHLELEFLLSKDTEQMKWLSLQLVIATAT
jgi:hypothetical protein